MDDVIHHEDEGLGTFLVPVTPLSQNISCDGTDYGDTMDHLKNLI